MIHHIIWWYSRTCGLADMGVDLIGLDMRDARVQSLLAVDMAKHTLIYFVENNNL